MSVNRTREDHYVALLGERGCEARLPFAFAGASEEREGGFPHVEAVTAKRRYHLCRPPGLWTPVQRGLPLSGAIVVLNARRGLRSAEIDQLLAARRLGVNRIVALHEVASTDDRTWLEQREMEFRWYLDECGFGGNETPVVRGTLDEIRGPAPALGPRFLAALDTHLERPPVAAEFLFVVEGAYNRPIGVVATGEALRGRATIGDELDVLGAGVERRVTLTGLDSVVGGPPSWVAAGSGVALQFDDLTREDIGRSLVIAAPIAVHNPMATLAPRNAEGREPSWLRPSKLSSSGPQGRI